MSLHDLANQVQSAGRNDDKVLVHMTPGEVSGLQSLAMAHGGSLTTNPETGLPEAGFLSSLLPMAIGFGLAPFTGGMSAALITGAGYTAATGSLKKGIMAGLGAYGGAGLAGGLSSLGTAAAAPATAGLSPTVAANTSTLAGTSPLANVGNAAVSSVDDIFMQAAKAPVAGTAAATTPGMTSAALNQTPVYNIAQYPNKFIPPAPSVVSTTTPMSAADKFALVDKSVPYNETFMRDPNAFVTTKVPSVSSDPYTKGLLNKPPAGFDQYRYADKLTPRPSVSYTPPKPIADFSNIQGQGGIPSNAVNTTGQVSPYREYMSRVGEGAKTAFGSTDGLKALYSATEAAAPYASVAGLGSTAMNYMESQREEAEEARRRAADKSPGMIRPYEFDYGATGVASQPYTGSAERTYFQPSYTALTPYEAPGPEYRKAEGGIAAAYAAGGPVEQMANMNYVGMNTGYPMASLQTPMYSNPTMQTPEATNVIAPSADAGVGAYSGEQRFATGGISHLGDYSDGGRLLKGPGDGVSDSIPASIGNRQPARLADGEFVVPARIVSELGNGSTEAGARKLYAMMDRVQKARRKTTGEKQVARNTKAEKLLPA